jgi:hypothetical protein
MRIERDVGRRVSRRCRLVAPAREAWTIRGLEAQVATDKVGFVGHGEEKEANVYGGRNADWM